MSADYRSEQAARAREAWRDLLADPGEPRRIDASVLVRPAAEMNRPSRIILDLTTERGDDLGQAAVYLNEWYPGCVSTVPYSHYSPALWRVLTSRDRRGRGDEPLRLQVLKAVAAPTTGGRLTVVLLKFIIAPEYTLTGSEIENTYGCPLSTFYTRFIGVSWDPRRDRRNAAARVSGEAIHEGYGRAAASLVAGSDADHARTDFLEGVRSVWLRQLPTLFLGRPTRPGVDHTRPIQARDPIVDYCLARWGVGTTARLYHERLFYAPARGLSGRADRIEEEDGDGLPDRVVEVKSGTSFGAEKDPITSREHPGGLQSLAYLEILRSFGLDRVAAVVEEVNGTSVTPLPLHEHPIVTRRGIDLAADDERVIDLIAQIRNVAYCAASGLLTGYDRFLLDDAGQKNRFLGREGGEFSLYRSTAPCQMCAAGQRGICSQARNSRVTPLPHLFRYLPGRLFAYWAWFHRQLKAEEEADRQALYHLIATPAADLEGREGMTLGDLRVVNGSGREVELGREVRLETRIREDDRVLVTPEDRRPGQVLSVEGVVTQLTEQTITVRLNDRLDDRHATYRVDQLGGFDMRPWQLEGLADFVLSAMTAAEARGRQIGAQELPILARILLGVERPQPLGTAPVPDAADLNEDQRRAVAAALALDPGQLLLIQGPPGTGKTTLIAHLARAVLARYFFNDTQPERRPILILANTHRAANEVVRKIVTRFPDLRPFLVRVGSRRADMEPEVAAQLLVERSGAEAALRASDLATDGPETLVRVIQHGVLLHDRAGIFVGTLGAADAADLRGLSFEMVVVDETGQATEPAMLQSLRHLPEGIAGRLVLIGDHLQLPPVVRADLAPPPVPVSHAQLGLREGDSLRTSAFERLSRLYPETVVTLTEQYRMNAPICGLVSETFYGGLLRPGSDDVARHHVESWLNRLGVADATGLLGGPKPVVLIDTAADPAARDSGARFTAGASQDDARDNPREARIVASLVAELAAAVPEGSRRAVLHGIGIISPYRRQNNRIRQELLARGITPDEVHVDTVDRFQGGEREIVIVSLVNSNDACAIGSLNREWRRLNVAISRARAKLVIVADRRTFTWDSGNDDDAPARQRFRALFDQIDALAAQEKALVIDSRTIRAG